MTPLKRTQLQRKSTLSRTPKTAKQKAARAKRLAKQKLDCHSPYWCKKADAVWSKVVRSVGRCAKCGTTSKQLQAHHLIRRQNVVTRHDINNGICLCAYDCHKFGEGSAHSNPVVFSVWLNEALPERWMWVRMHRFDAMPAGIKPDYKQRFEDLSAILKELEG